MMRWLLILLLCTCVYAKTPAKNKKVRQWKPEATKTSQEQSLKEVKRLLRKIEKRSPDLDKMKRALAGEGLPTPTPTPQFDLEQELSGYAE